MNNSIKIIGMALITLALAGCATKQYPQAPMVTGEESTVMDCKAINIEIAKTNSIKQEIDRTGEFDARTVFGFLGDFGIGNGIAKSGAYEKVNARLQQLEALRAAKCANESK